MQKAQQQITLELSEIRAKHIGLKRWWLSKKKESLKSFCEEVLHYAHSRLPRPVSRDVSLVALDNLYAWLQVGEEDLDSKRATDELTHPFDLLTEEQIKVLNIRGDLYKIKNHTAIVCLDQLRQDGFTLYSIFSL